MSKTHTLKRALTPLAVLAPLTLILAACGDRAGEADNAGAAAAPSNETLAAAVEGDGDLDTLEAVLANAGLTTVLEGVGPYTVFAPADAAFTTPAEFTADTAKAPAAALVRAHIVPGALTRRDILAAIDRAGTGKVEMRTMADGLLSFSKDGDAVVVIAPDGASARLVGDEVLLSNGVLQPVDALLVKAAAPAACRGSGRPGHEVVDVCGAGDGDRDAVLVDVDLAAGDRVVVGQDPHLVLLGGVQRDHRPAAHLEQLVHGQHAAAQHDRDLDVDGVDLAHEGL